MYIEKPLLMLRYQEFSYSSSSRRSPHTFTPESLSMGASLNRPSHDVAPKRTPAAMAAKQMYLFMLGCLVGVSIGLISAQKPMLRLMP